MKYSILTLFFFLVFFINATFASSYLLNTEGDLRASQVEAINSALSKMQFHAIFPHSKPIHSYFINQGYYSSDSQKILILSFFVKAPAEQMGQLIQLHEGTVYHGQLGTSPFALFFKNVDENEIQKIIKSINQIDHKHFSYHDLLMSKAMANTGAKDCLNPLKLPDPNLSASQAAIGKMPQTTNASCYDSAVDGFVTNLKSMWNDAKTFTTDQNKFWSDRWEMVRTTATMVINLKETIADISLSLSQLTPKLAEQIMCSFIGQQISGALTVLTGFGASIAVIKFGQFLTKQAKMIKALANLFKQNPHVNPKDLEQMAQKALDDMGHGALSDEKILEQAARNIRELHPGKIIEAKPVPAFLPKDPKVVNAMPALDERRFSQRRQEIQKTNNQILGSLFSRDVGLSKKAVQDLEALSPYFRHEVDSFITNVEQTKDLTQILRGMGKYEPGKISSKFTTRNGTEIYFKMNPNTNKVEVLSVRNPQMDEFHAKYGKSNPSQDRMVFQNRYADQEFDKLKHEEQMESYNLFNVIRKSKNVEEEVARYADKVETTPFGMKVTLPNTKAVVYIKKMNNPESNFEFQATRFESALAPTE